MRFLWIFFLFMLCLGTSVAQSLKGRVTDKKGEPIVGATFFVREILQGSAADENGNFQLALKPGTYTCEISSLGFEKKVQKVQVVDKQVKLDIILEPMVYMLKELKVTNSGEDPAYYIMRNAIANAPRHLNQVTSYRSEVYTKGTMKLEKVPRLLTLNAEAKKVVTPLIGKLLLLESVLEVKFKAPNTYDRKVVAFSSTIPDDIDPGDALDIITASIYDPEVMGMVSPLAPRAFAYYRFRFVECYTEGERTINKIRVEPKKKNGQLADGWLYIAEDLWSVVSFQLSVEQMGVEARIKGVFNEVEPTVFLPTSYDVNVKVGIFGIKAGGQYYSSVKYNDVVIAGAPTVAPERPVVAKTATKQQQRLKRRVEELSQKEDISTREAYQLANLTQRAIEAERNDTTPPLQIKSNAVVGKVVVDSLATRKDSLYWVQMRTVPLKQEEQVSYVRKDSLYQVMKQVYNEEDSARANKSQSIANKILWGQRFKLNKKITLTPGGILRVMPEYNFVDGFWLGQNLKLDVDFNKKQRLQVTPSLYYATARKAIAWNVETDFRYAPMRMGVLKINGGDRSTGFNGNNDIWRFENMITSFVCADNFMKFYRKRYIDLHNEIEVAHGFMLKVGGAYEKRNVLENNISYNLFNRTPGLNTPSSEGGVNMPDNTSANAFVQLNYTPRLNYRVRNGKKEYIYSDFPTISVQYKKGFAVANTSGSDYQRMDVSIRQHVSFGIFDRLSYLVTAGQFFDMDELYFPDYKHFTTAGWVLNTDDFFNSFFLSDYYSLYSKDKWIQGAVNYTSLYLFLKRLPFLQKSLFNEAVHVRYLCTPDIKHYTEWGYSLGMDGVGRVGVFVSFHRHKYDGVGVRFYLPINLLKTY